VVNINDAPRVANFGGNLTYQENATPLTITTTATVADVDSPNFAGGHLTAKLVAGATSSDLLSIRSVSTASGEINTAGNQVFVGTILLGTFTGGGGNTPLVVSLNNNATASRVQQLLWHITFSNGSDNPATAARTVQVTVGDGGQTSAPVSKQLSVTSVNDKPVIGNFGDNVSYRENAAPLRIASTATVTDIDSANFNSGKLTVKLTVKLTAGGSSQDRLGILHVGTAAGQINLQGNQVLVGSILLGTFTGGAGTTPLVVTLGSNATPGRVQVLLRYVTFSNTSETHRRPSGRCKSPSAMAR